MAALEPALGDRRARLCDAWPADAPLELASFLATVAGGHARMPGSAAHLTFEQVQHLVNDVSAGLRSPRLPQRTAADG